jgi:hypothetical protein
MVEPARARRPDADEGAAVGERTDAVDQVLAARRQLARSFDDVLAGV